MEGRSQVSPGKAAQHVPASQIAFTGGGFAIIAVTFGLARYSYGLFIPEIGREFALAEETLGLIASASYLGYIGATILSLWLSGIVGPRLLIVTGAVSAAIGMALVAITSSVSLLTVGVVIAGASPGFVFAPISDAVMQAVPAARQNRSWTVINSGNGAGVLIAGIVALGMAGEWRWSWAAFSALAVITVFWTAAVMPSRRIAGDEAPTRLHVGWFFRPEALPLYGLSLLAGGVTTVYWTFATSLMESAGRDGQFGGDGWPFEQLRIIFWSLLGAAGIAGAVSGDLISRFGLKRTLRGTCLAMAASIGLLAAVPGSLPAIAISAIVFGITFILVTGAIGVWSVHTFRRRPSAGFGATFLVFALGALISPAIAGACAVRFGLVSVFAGIMTLSGLMALLKPGTDIRSMSGQ
ncbi:MFS transporter [Neoaquamicrobium sediminum]|uniref:MFS transporter n=1 Tax=Neoaquamicrobium sediminum TaxID=1849104 RepID=UPI00156344DC|nr:MFS transporter [Mesorhizobium sediminum]NRC57368.1 YbfB/YjiJ family MFS transporter [Mesorhizobium sediminum]